MKVRLGDICDILNGFAFKSENYVSKGIRIIRIANVQNGYIEDTAPCFYPITAKDELNKYMLKENDLLISLTGNVGRVALLEKSFLPAALNQRVACLRIREDAIDKKYLFYQLNSNLFEKKCIESSNGIAQKNMSTEWLKDYCVFIPKLEEQKAIVKELDKISNLIIKRKQQLEKLDFLIKSQFIEMFGDPIANSRLWPTNTVEQICEHILGGGTPSKSRPEFYEGQIPWVTPKDMKTTTIVDSIDHITEEGVKNSTTNIIPIGAVLMVIRSGILKHTLPVALSGNVVTINQDMKAFVVRKEIINATFLLHYFQIIEKDVLSGVRGVTADNIDFKDFVKRKIILPPLKLQSQFAHFVEQTDKSKLKIKQSLEKLETLKKSLMQKYFG